LSPLSSFQCRWSGLIVTLFMSWFRCFSFRCHPVVIVLSLAFRDRHYPRSCLLRHRWLSTSCRSNIMIIIVTIVIIIVIISHHSRQYGFVFTGFVFFVGRRSIVVAIDQLMSHHRFVVVSLFDFVVFVVWFLGRCCGCRCCFIVVVIVSVSSSSLRLCSIL